MIEQIECQNCGTLNAAGSYNCAVCRGPLSPEAIEALDDQTGNVEMAIKEPPGRREDEEQASVKTIEMRQYPRYVLTGVIVLLVLGGGFTVEFNPLFLLYYRVFSFLSFIPFYYNRLTFTLFEIAVVVVVARRFGITPAWISSAEGISVGRSRVLGKAQIVDRWATLLAGGKGMGSEVIQKTIQLIRESEAPDIAMKETQVSAGILQGLMGAKKDFLVASNSVNPRLKPYRMYLYAGDYGINLQVYWYVAYQPGYLHMLLNLLLFIPVVNLFFLPMKALTSKQDNVMGLDIFDEQELRNYVTNAHHCVLQAVDQLGKEHNIDTSIFNRQSKGFLGVS